MKKFLQILKDAFTPVGSRENEFKYQKEKELKELKGKKIYWFQSRIY